MKHPWLPMAFALIQVFSLVGEEAGESPWEPIGLSVTGFAGTNTTLDAQSLSRPVLGASVRWLPIPYLGISLDFASLSKDYYWYDDAAKSWKGPVAWSVIEGKGFTSESEWLFYDTRNYLSPAVAIALPLAQAELRAAFGMAFVIPVFSEALSYYPDAEIPYKAFLTSFDVMLGYSVKLGAAYTFFDLVTIGFDYLFISDSFEQFAREISSDPGGTIRRSGNLLISAGVRL